MTRARSSIATALAVVGLGSACRAQNPPLPNPSLPGAVPPAATAPAPAQPERGPIRGFFRRLTREGKKTRSAHPDWSTGGDAKLSKPWLR